MHVYTIYNEKYFQKFSFCVITHLIGQNGRAVCENMLTMEMYEVQSASCVLGAAYRPSIDREYVQVQPWPSA